MPPLLLLWSTQLLSALGDRLHEIALMWTAVESVGAEAGWVAAAGTVSRLVFLLPGGVVADRWDRRKVMLGADVLRALAVATLAIAGFLDAITLPHLALVAAVIGALDALFTPALQASLPALAPEPLRLQRVNAWLDVNRRLALILGPALAGVLLAYIPLARFFALDAATYVASAGALLAIAPAAFGRAPAARAAGHARREVGEAAALVWRHAPLRWALAMLVLINLAYAAGWIVGLPLLTRDVFGRGPESYGTLIAAYGLGNVGSNLFLSGRVGFDRTRMMFAGGIVWGAGLCLLAFAPSFEAALAVCALTAIGGPMTDLMVLRIIQTEFPAAQIGKVFSLRAMTAQVSIGVGLLVAAPLYAAATVRGGLALCGAAVVMVATVALLRFRAAVALVALVILWPQQDIGAATVANVECGAKRRSGLERLAPCRHDANRSLTVAAPMSCEARPPSPPARGFLAAARGAPLVAQGRVAAVKRVDRHGYRATLRLDRALRGEVEPGAAVVVGWEELSPKRAPRLADGDAVLLALEPLPTTSLWRQRFAGETAPVFVIAERGDALLRRPSAAETDAVAAVIAAPTSAVALAQVAEVSPHLTGDALAELALIPSPAQRGRAREGADSVAIDQQADAILARIAENPARTHADRAAVIQLAADRRLGAMRPALERLARPGSELEPEALAALAALDGGLDPARAKALIALPDPELRAVGARWLRGLDAERELPILVRRDPSPAVRLAAAETLAAAGTVWGIEGAIAALGDGDAAVRTGTSRAIALRGKEAIPYLRTALGADPTTAAGAIVTLAMMGRPGLEVVAAAARSHPDERVRTLARLALGDAPGHEH